MAPNVGTASTGGQHADIRGVRRSIAATLLVLYLSACSTYSERPQAMAPQMAPDAATLDKLRTKLEGRRRVGIVVDRERIEARYPTLDGRGIHLGLNVSDSTVPWSDVSRLEVRSSAASQGLLIGAATGLVVGGLGGLAWGLQCRENWGGYFCPATRPSGGDVAAWAAVGALGGALVFGLFGAMVSAPFGRWSTVYRGQPQPATPAIALRPNPGGVAVAATVAF